MAVHFASLRIECSVTVRDSISSGHGD